MFYAVGALTSSENACSLPNMEFDSPAQTVQPFHSYAEEIPTPQFTASVSDGSESCHAMHFQTAFT